MKNINVPLDRIAGVMLGMAAGDALGAGYEFGSSLPEDAPITMKGGTGFGWAPGEWTDDTSMAIPILEAVVAGRDLRSEAVLDSIVAGWAHWAQTAPDIGVQLRAILSGSEPNAASVRSMAREYHDRHGRSASNGSLMRTAPIALAYLDDPVGLAEAARAVSDLTHFDDDAGDACVLWSLAIRHAVVTGVLDVRVGLEALPTDRQELWATRIDEAEEMPPAAFTHNGWVVQALQAAWSAIARTCSTDASHLRHALEAAVRGGHDTDTVAAIAGSLLGARWGASAVPAEWRRVIHGWPGMRGTTLMRFAVLAAHGGESDTHGWPRDERFDYSAWGDVSTLVRHPHDDGVWLGAIGALDALPAEVDAVVSLCRVGASQVPEHITEHVEVWLADRDEPDQNPNLDFVLNDTAAVITALRAEGHTVLLHCVQAQSRTPSVAALYAAQYLGIPLEQAYEDVCGALPAASPRLFLKEASARICGHVADVAVEALKPQLLR